MQLELSSAALLACVRRPLQGSPRGKRRLTRAVLVACVVTASVGMLLPASASETATETAKLLAMDGVAGDSFGGSVAVAGDTALVGAFGDDDNGTDSGSAYVFRYDGTGWVEEAKLTGLDTAEGDFFGSSVALAGQTAVVGASRDDDNGSNSGSAYVFRYDGTGWVEEAKLTALDGAAADEFGFSVVVEGDSAVVGARFDDDNGSSSGSAYVFRDDGMAWIEEANLTASDGAEGDFFGRSVALSGDTAVIGAYGDDGNGFSSGSVYVFHYDGTAWVEEVKLTASDGAANDSLGISVAVAGDTALIGASGDEDNSGAAYVFSVPEPSAWALQGSALAVLAGLAHRGRRRSQGTALTAILRQGLVRGSQEPFESGRLVRIESPGKS